MQPALTDESERVGEILHQILHVVVGAVDSFAFEFDLVEKRRFDGDIENMGDLVGREKVDV